MAGHGVPAPMRISAAGMTLGIAATRWHADIVDRMVDRALAAGDECGVKTAHVVRVGGAVELPVVAQAFAENCDAVVALGVVIRGDTAHFDYVCKAVTEGLTRVALDARTPVAHGVLTVDTVEQARARAGFDDSPEDKGWEAVMAAFDARVAIDTIRRG